MFGWTYRHVNTVLTSLDAAVNVSPTGLMTVFNVKATGESLTESAKRTVALNYLFQVTGVVKGAFQADDRLRRQAVDAFETLGRLQSELRYHITDSLTSLDELQMYLSVARQLRVLDAGQVERLVASIQELRKPQAGAVGALDEEGLRRVSVTYTVGFPGDALSRALTQDLAGSPVVWWDDDGQAISVEAKSHRMALESIYVDRLIASHTLPRRSGRNEYAVPAMYRAGLHRSLREHPNLPVSRWARQFTVQSDGTPAVTVRASQQDVEWARRHYFVNVWMAEFLDRFRQTLSGSGQMPIGDLQSFLDGLVKRLVEVGEGPHASLPFMLLDELVRRTQTPGADSRRALLEVTLFDAEGKTANYIPIVG
jgi:hypothetical protein